MSTMRNDPVKLRGLSGELKSAGAKWRDQVTELTKAHRQLMQRCEDRRIDEFSVDFRKAVRAIEEMDRLLAATGKHLDQKHDAAQNRRNGC